MSQFDTDLGLRKTIAEMVETYQREAGVIELAYARLWESKCNLETAFGKHFHDFDTVPERVHQDENMAVEIIARLKCQAWQSIVNRLRINRLVSAKRWKELEAKLQDPKQLPDITVGNVSDMLTAYQQNAMDYLKESIKEVYDWLRPHTEYAGAKYKTNIKNARIEIGRKIIITSIVSNGYGNSRFHVNYSRAEQELVALDMVFMHLAGQAVPEGYRSPLVDAINTSADGRAETDYFKVICYQNGNIHLEFKRMDLVAKFNAVAGGMNLKPGAQDARQ